MLEPRTLVDEPSFQPALNVALRCSAPAQSADCGSKVLAFMVADWVVARRPHAVFIEHAINDGDTLLESGDAASLGWLPL